jgi:hypothetical protein
VVPGFELRTLLFYFSHSPSACNFSYFSVRVLYFVLGPQITILLPVPLSWLGLQSCATMSGLRNLEEAVRMGRVVNAEQGESLKLCKIFRNHFDSCLLVLVLDL